MIVNETAGDRRSDRAGVDDILAQCVAPLAPIPPPRDRLSISLKPAPHLVHVAELGDRLRARRVRRHASADQLLDARLEMKPHLVVDVGADVAAPEPEVAIPARGSHGSHGGNGDHHARDGGRVVDSTILFRPRSARRPAAVRSIELRALLLVGAAPLRLDPATLFHAVQRRVERAVEHVEDAGRPVADESRDGVAVHRSPRQRAEHEHVERALQEVELAGRHAPTILDHRHYIKC